MATFKSLGLNSKLLHSIEKLGFETPTEVQVKVIPLLLDSSTDLIALAQTGTGKTAAFGFPLLQLINTKSKNTQGLILSPTRELCLQITNDLSVYAQNQKNINIVAIYGGANISEQAKKIKRGSQIIVATPGRLKDMIKRKFVNISNIKYCVLDEADEMLNMGFYEDIKDILKSTPREKNSWLFSATMPSEVGFIARQFMSSPKEVTIGKVNTSSKNIVHQYYVVSRNERYSALRSVISLNKDIFGCVFCRTKIDTQKVSEKLINDGYKAAAIHGDLSQNQRDAVMQSFRKKKIQLLIATDVAARGIDVDDITHIINYRLPDEIETYTHRSGRTGRAGKQGISIIFATKSEEKKIRLIEKKLNIKVPRQEMPSYEAILNSKVDSWIDTIKKTPINSNLKSYLPRVIKNFRNIDKESLIELILSKEFEKHDLNLHVKNSNDHVNNKKLNSNNNDRFFINIGARDQYDWQTLKDFLRSYLKIDKNDISQVEVMKNFSFFSIKKNHSALVLKSFENLTLDNRKVSVELTKKNKTFSFTSNQKKKKNNNKRRFR